MRIEFDKKRTGDNIRFYRQQMALSQKELASMARMSETILNHYEKGHFEQLMSHVSKIANVLNVHPNQIMAFVVEGEE